MKLIENYLIPTVFFVSFCRYVSLNIVIIVTNGTVKLRDSLLLHAMLQQPTVRAWAHVPCLKSCIRVWTVLEIGCSCKL